MLRGDIARLGRCTQILISEGGSGIRRSKPFKYAYEKDIVLYAHFKKLDYFSTECTYSPGAYRGFARTFLKDLERERPSAILDIIRSGESFEIRSGDCSADAETASLPSAATSRAMRGPQSCERCGYVSSNRLCKACVLLEGLNRGLPRLGISRQAESVANAGDLPSTTGAARRPVVHFADISVDLSGIIK